MNEEMKLALAEVARDLGKPGTADLGKSAFSQIIVESIEPNRLTLDFFSSFFRTRQLGLGDQLVKRVYNRGFPVRTMVPGSNHLADQFVPPSEIMTYMIDYLIAKTRYSMWELQRAELGTLAEFRRRMEEALVDKLVARVFTLISSVWNPTNTPDNYATIATAVTQTGLEAMIENVLESAGNVRAIVGTRKALMPIYKFAGVVEYTPSGASVATPLPLTTILEEWRTKARVTSFYGVPLIEFPQIKERTKDNYDKKLVAEDEIQIIGDNAGEVVLYGGIDSQEHIDTSIEPPDYSLAIWRGYGMIIDEPKNIGIIKIT